MTVTDRFDDNTLRDRLVELTRDLVIIPSTARGRTSGNAVTSSSAITST
jgi:hypothetical protein